MNDWTPELRRKTIAWTLSGCLLLALISSAFVINYNSATPITFQSIAHNRKLNEINGIKSEMELVKRQVKNNTTVTVGTSGTDVKFNLGKMEALKERYDELSKKLAEAEENLNK